MEKIKNLILLALATVSLAMGAPILVGLGSDGKALKFGSGFDGENSRPVASVVDNNGGVAFLAPMTDVASNEKSPLKAIYKRASDATKPIILGYAKEDYEFQKQYFFPDVTPENYQQAIFRLVSNSSRTKYVVLSCEFKNPGPHADITEIILRDSKNNYVALDNSFKSSSLLSMSGDGNTICIGNGSNNYILFDGDMNTLPVPSVLNGDGQAVAISNNGNNIYFTAKVSGLLHLFKCDRIKNTLIDIGQIEDAEHGDFLAAPTSAISADAVAFVSNNLEFLSEIYGEPLSKDMAIGSQIIIYSNEKLTWCRETDNMLLQCTSPCISADGRYVAFSASETYNGISQIYRFDSKRRKFERVSQKENGTPSNENCEAPAISPNGRYVSFTTKANNLGPGADNKNYNVWLSDLGLEKKEIDISSSISELRIPLATTPQLESATFMLDFSGSYGSFFSMSDRGVRTELTANKSYSSDLLPIYFAPKNNTHGKLQLKITINEGGNSTQELFIINIMMTTFSKNHISCTRTGGVGQDGGVRLNNSLCAISDDASIALFSTNSKLFDDSLNWKIYARFIDSQETIQLANQPNAFDALAISGIGTLAYYVSEGTLYKQSIVNNSKATVIKGMKACSSIAIDKTGANLACIAQGKPYIVTNNIPRSLSTSVTDLKEAFISQDGNTAAFLSNDGSLYCWNLDDGLRLLMKNIRNATLGGNGYEAVVVTMDGDVLRISTTSGEITGECSLKVEGSAFASKNLHYLVFMKGGQLYRYNFYTGTTHVVSAPDDNITDGYVIESIVASTYDGTAILFAGNSCKLVEKTDNTKFELFLATFVGDCCINPELYWRNLASSSWQLLSAPCELRTSEIMEAFANAQLWTWNGVCYTEPGEYIGAGCGFAVFVSETPMVKAIAGETANVSKYQGWNLISAPKDKALQDDMLVLENNAIIRKSPTAGYAGWLFVK